MSLRCWAKPERSRKELENKIVGTNTPEEERGYRETQATRLRHTESPEQSLKDRNSQVPVGQEDALGILASIQGKRKALKSCKN